MKKLTTLALVLVLALSLTACGKKTPDGATGNPSEDVTQTTPVENESASLENLMDWMRGGTFYFAYTNEMEYEGIPMTSKGSYATDGGNYAISTETTILGQVMKNRIIAKGGVTHIIDDEEKTIRKSTADVSRYSEQIADVSKLNLKGQGQGEVKGKVLPYEEYIDGDMTIRYYMDGGKVYAIESEGEGAKSVMVIENASKTVPKGIFDLPADYVNLGY